MVLALVFVLKPPYPHANAQTPIKKQVEVSTAKAEPIAVQPTPPPQPQPVAQPEAVATPQPPTYSGSHTDWLAAAGIPQSEWAAVDYVVSRESGWCPTKWNGDYGVCPLTFIAKYSVSSSKAYGLCQSLPAVKMAKFGADYLTNPVTQLKWCNDYAQSRYGGWWGAQSFWVKNHWW